jgi:hypothetical protein
VLRIRRKRNEKLIKRENRLKRREGADEGNEKYGE